MSSTPSRTSGSGPPASRATSLPTRHESNRRQQQRQEDHRGSEVQDDREQHRNVQASQSSTSVSTTQVISTTTSSQPQSGPTSTSNRPSTSNSPSPFLRSLLETADRIAQSPVLDLTGDSWTAGRNERSRSRSAHRRQTGNGEAVRSSTPTTSATGSNNQTLTTLPSSPGRIRLTRRYTGRPHVPGEDSGSDADEGGDDEHRTASDNNNATTSEVSTTPQLDEERLIRFSNLLGQIHQGVGFANGTEQEGNTTRSEPERPSNVDEERPQTRGRDVPPSPPIRYATSGPAPTRDSFYDWAPVRRELQRRSRVSRSGSRSRSRSRSQSSVRRWRPSETTTIQGPRPIILIDGRGDNQDRTERNREDSPRSSLQADVEDIRAAIRSARAVANSSQNAIVERSSEARRDLERALREYRIARRALRSQSQTQHTDDVERDNMIGTNTTGPARRIWQSPRRFSVQPWQPQTGSETNTQRTTVHDVYDNSAQIERNSNGARRLGEVDAAVPFSILSQRAQDAIEEQRRERQFIREWVRNRPRNSQQQRESAGQAQLEDDSVATGPLFTRDRTTIIGGSANGDRNSSEGVPRFSGDRYRRLVETYKRLKKAEEEQESPAHRKAKAMIQYITQLKECGRDQQAAWDLAMCLGLHGDGLEQDAALDLPVSAQELPTPVYTSWLQPGVIWKGSQCAGNIDEGARMLHARARRHRERMRREREERERVENAQRQNENLLQRSSDRTRDPLERTILGGGSSFLSWSESMRVLEDAERRLSSMLDRQNERLRDEEGWSSSTAGERRLLLGDGGFSRRSAIEREEEEAAANAAKHESEGDHWNVKVTIHEVDWQSMTLTGTMSASQLPDRTRMGMGYQPLNSTATAPEHEPIHHQQEETSNDSDDVSMDSFFTGHIIDFRNHHTLHTSTAFGWKVGGLETDMSYWAGVGPFRKEIEREVKLRRAEKGGQKLKAAGKDKYCGDVLSEEEKEEIKKTVMARCLGSKKWLEQNFGDGEPGGLGGWVLMRWKEQCFVTPGLEPNPQTINSSNPSSAIAPHSLTSPGFYPRNSNRIWDTSTLSDPTHYDLSGNNPNSAIWGLTISGFYYVAMNRLTGSVEALYFDPGSQPFQKLRMVPEAEFPTTQKNTHAHMSGDEEETELDVRLPSSLNYSNQKRDKVDRKKEKTSVGLRSAFPIVELR